MLVNAGIINHADPVRNLYKIDPALSRTNERASVIYATVLGVGVNNTKARHIPTYEVGDCVLYVSEDDTTKHKISAWAIILGTYPGAVETNVSNLSEFKNKEISPLYDDITKLLGYYAEFNKSGFIYSWSKNSKGTDYVVGSQDVILNLSDFDGYFRSKYAGLYLNSITHELTEFGINHTSEFISKSSKSIIINNKPYEQTIYYGDVNTGVSNAANALFNNLLASTKKGTNRYEQYSDLIGGYKATTVVNDTPVTSIEEAKDGVIKLKSLNGIILDKDINIPLVTPQYTNSLVSDEAIQKDANLLESETIPGTWSYKNGAKNGAINWDILPVNTEATTSTIESIPVTKAKARIAALPDGSIILRDAWGSEIRLKDGDIQLSAANKITLLSTTDILNIAGGVNTINAMKGVQIGSVEGSVDIAAEKDVIINSNEQITLNGKTDVYIIGDKVNLDGNEFTIDSDDLLLNGKSCCTISSFQTSVIGDSRCIFKCSNSILDLNNSSLIVSARQTSFYCNLRIDKGIYRSGKLVDGGSVISTSGDRQVQINGSILLDGFFHANKTITSSSLIASKEMAAKNIRLNGGIYGLKNKPKEIKLQKRDINNFDMSSINFETRASRSGNSILTTAINFTKTKIEKALKNLFSFTEKKKLTIFKPMFKSSSSISGISNLGNSDKNMRPCKVDISGETRYIYPGNIFWNKSGLKETNPVDIEDLSIKVTSSYSGVTCMKI